MSFQKIAPFAFLALLMGSACIYASYPYMMPLSENISGKVLEKSKQSVDKVYKPVYPVGTFEYEVKRTL